MMVAEFCHLVGHDCAEVSAALFVPEGLSPSLISFEGKPLWNLAASFFLGLGLGYTRTK